MPVKSKVQTIFCGLFCIIKELHKRNPTNCQTQSPTSLFIDKTQKIAKLRLKNSTDVNTACSKIPGAIYQKNYKQANIKVCVERLNRMPLENRGICERHKGSVQLFLFKERITEKKLFSFILISFIL